LLIKKIIILPIIFLFSYLFAVFTHAIDISASAAVVINADTKEIIYEKNAFEKRSMASTTKIMTSVLAIESGRMNDSVEVTSSALTEGSSIGLKAGYVLTLSDIVYGMLLESGNDAANVCALHLGGSFEEFASMMNRKASELGMTETNFVTPSGLDDEKHYTTAYDMAVLGAYCIKNPVFREICSDKKHSVTFTEPDITVSFSNHNRLLDSCEGVFGVKTGFTKKSGRCLVSACERDGAELICVTLNAPDDWNDHIKLYDASFAELNRSTMKLTSLSEVTVYGGIGDKAEIYCDEYVHHYKEDGTLTQQIILPDIIYAPVKKGEILGEVRYYSDEALVNTGYIYSKSDIPCAEETYKSKRSLAELLTDFFKRKD